jgi:hypothetical protein
MMISITSTTFDPDGPLILHPLPDSAMTEVSRRVNRTATLDGGAVVNDGGYSVADRTWRLRWVLRSEAELRRLQAFVQTRSSVRVASREGCFRAIVSKARADSTRAELELLLLEKTG